MAEVTFDPANLDFRISACLGEDNPLLRGVVGLQSRCDEEAGIHADSAERRARQLSSSMYGSSVLIAAVESGTPLRPVASVMRAVTYGSRLRSAIELSNLLVDPKCSDPETLAGVMVALNCTGRNRFRSIGIDVKPAHEVTVDALRQLGFEKDEEASGVEIYVGVPPEDRYTIGSGHSAIGGTKRMPGGKDILSRARQSLIWN